MITKKEILEVTAELRKNNPEYDLMCRLRRPEQNHRIFIIDDKIFFEYWNTHEYEFTVYSGIEGKEREDYYSMAWNMVFYANQIHLAPKQLRSFIATCKQKAAIISGRYN